MPSPHISLTLYISLFALAMGKRVVRERTQSNSSLELAAVTCRDYSTDMSGHASVNTILDIRDAQATVVYSENISKGYEVFSSSFTETFRSVETDIFVSYGQSAEISFGVPNVGPGSATYNLLMEFRLTMQNTFKEAYTTSRTISESTETKVTGTVKPGESLALYQVVTNMNGATLTSAYYNYKPSVSSFSIPAKLSFNFGAAVPLLIQLGDTRPGSANKNEWESVRSQYFWAQNQPIDKQVRGMLAVFSGITPGNDNKDEWEHIRQTSSQISGQDQTYCHHTVRLFCDMLAGIHPGSQNKAEWQRIRDKASDCTSGLSR